MRTGARCAATGLAVAAALPPWGWWPLAFVGLAFFDRLIADQPWPTRFRRGWLAALWWLAPGMLWMVDLTAPGYVVAIAYYSALFGGAAALAPAGPGRRLALPGAFVLAEASRWYWPFGGVPLATLPMTQVASPLAPVVRTLGSLLLVALCVAIGGALAAALDRHWRTVGAIAAIAVVAVGWAAIASDGYPVGRVRVAAVQGGGPQRTRADVTENPFVLQRHVDATRTIEQPVDIVLWPENVVNPEAPPPPGSPRFEGLLYEDEARQVVTELARELDALFLPGWFTHISPTNNDNFTEAVDGTGRVVDTYHKVRTVPFGEFVPLRSLIEPFASESLPAREVLPGDGPAVLRTPSVTLGIAISWEIFFDHRARDAVRNGGQLLVNPTNGSSYWLTIVQTQQVASSRLRALETGRWVVQAAPTGFSAVIDPSGRVLERSAISEAKVIEHEVELREGKTLAVRVGAWPMLAIAAASIASGHLIRRRSPSPDRR